MKENLNSAESSQTKLEQPANDLKEVQRVYSGIINGNIADTKENFDWIMDNIENFITNQEKLTPEQEKIIDTILCSSEDIKSAFVKVKAAKQELNKAREKYYNIILKSRKKIN